MTNTQALAAGPAACWDKKLSRNDTCVDVVLQLTQEKSWHFYCKNKSLWEVEKSADLGTKSASWQHWTWQQKLNGKSHSRNRKSRRAGSRSWVLSFSGVPLWRGNGFSGGFRCSLQIRHFRIKLLMLKEYCIKEALPCIFTIYSTV